MQGDRVKVGMVASLTGQFGDQGTQALAGANGWVRDVNATGGIFIGSNGRKMPVELKHYDDRGQTRLASSMTERLIVEDRVHLLLGPYSSVLTLAAAPVAERLQRVLWNHSGASDQIHCQGFRWIVGILTPASRYLLGVIDLVRERDPGARRLAIIRSSNGSFPAAVTAGVEAHAKRQGFQVPLDLPYNPPSEDFSPLLEQLEDYDTDVLVGVGRIQDELLLARQMVERRVRAKAIALVVAGIGQFGDAMGSRATGFMGPSQWETRAHYSQDYGPPASELAKSFESLRPGGSDYAMAQAYAAGLVAQRCVEEAGTLDNLALRQAANRLDFTTFYGRFKLDPSTGAQVGRSMVIVQWQDDRKVIVWPKELRQADILYPHRA